VSGCVHFCVSLTFAHGHLYGAVGSTGFLFPGASLGYTSVKPENQFWFYVQATGSGGPYGASVSGGPTNRGGTWWGVAYSPGFGFQIGGMLQHRLF
jgi:hypothetical protein